MNQSIERLEEKRIALQAEIDATKTQSERNRLGQFATPTSLAFDILKYASNILLPDEKVRFFDPAIGTGAFYSALRKVFSRDRIVEALGLEIDPHYKEPALKLWAKSGLMLKLADFTQETPTPRFNLIICNPPYVRHHHLQNFEKTRLRMMVYHSSRMNLSGLAGLYCYFLGLSHAWLAEGGIAGWLIPSEFMDVNYGQAIKHYLLDRVTLLQIHRFDPNDVQFSDALVSSAVVWFKKAVPPNDHSVKFSYGGTLLEPKISCEVPAGVLIQEPKWTRFPHTSVQSVNPVTTISDFFEIKRGLASGDNNFFILEAKEIISRGLPYDIFRPILPSPRFLPESEIYADPNGLPRVERQFFLLDTRLSEEEIKNRFPALFAYLKEGMSRGVNKRYLCQHRKPWYAQENRPPAPIVCTYLGRSDTKSGRPFRFILNHSNATVANVYLAMYPRANLRQAMEMEPKLIRRVWEALNQINPDKLIGEGRVYGGGLHKLEPKELANVDAAAIAKLIPGFGAPEHTKQLNLFGNGNPPARNSYNADIPKRSAG